MRTYSLGLALAGILLAVPGRAAAQEEEGGGAPTPEEEGTAAPAPDEGAAAPAPDEGGGDAAAADEGGAVSGSWEAEETTSVPHRWVFDMFGGGHFFSKDNELGARDVPEAAAPSNAFALGLRLGFWITPALGIEAEGIAIPSEAKFRDLAGGDEMDANSEQFVIGYRLNAIYQFTMG